MSHFSLMNPSRQHLICGVGGFDYSDVTSTDPFDAFQLPCNAAIVKIYFAVDTVFDVATTLTIHHNGTELITAHNLTGKGVVAIEPTGDVFNVPTTVKFELNQIPTQGSGRFLVEYIVIGRTQFTEDYS